MLNLSSEPITEEALTAVHEAGHVVGYLAAGFPFDRVTIVPTDEYLGCVLKLPGPRPEYNLHAAILLAGTIAVDVSLGSRWVFRDNMGYPDWAGARLVLSLKNRPPAEPLSPERQAEVDALIEKLGASRMAQVVTEIYYLYEPEIGAAVETELKKFARATERLIRRRWRDVLKIAAALLERKTLSYPEVLELVR